jgi:hypothetical protein
MCLDMRVIIALISEYWNILRWLVALALGAESVEA